MKTARILTYAIVFGLSAATTNVSASDASQPQKLTQHVVIEDIGAGGPTLVDVSTAIPNDQEIAIRARAAQTGPEAVANKSLVGAAVTVGDQFTITVHDHALGVDYDETFVAVMDGVHGIILVEKAAYDNYDAATDQYVFPNPNGCWRPEDRISTSQLAYVLSEIDNTIWPTNTSVFGEPLPRGAEGKKVWTLIFNIRDESYYDCSATSYIPGYFSASVSTDNNKNIVQLDTYDWPNRTGPDAANPYLYEGTVAHELEKLIHFDIDPDEPSWVNEGLADLAAFLCGYGHPSGRIAYYMIYHPMVSLTFWDGGVENYGASYLFQLYLYEKFGGAAFTAALVQEQANGIEGIQNTLAAFGHSETFDEIFDNWTIANYIDDTRKAGGKYGYDTLDVGSIDTWGYSIEQALTDVWWGPPEQASFSVPSDWFFGIEPRPSTAHYFRFINGKKAAVTIDGDDFAGNPAYSGTYQWYSDAARWAWRSFYQTFDIPASGATLSFQTLYDIEEDWDYGYVEVYDQTTGEWYTLNAPGTMNYVAHPQDNPNTPPGREPSNYEGAGRWHAFTGSSGGWVPVSMDLSPFAGHTIDLYFTTWQDVTFSGQMMYVDDISIPEIGFFDDIEAGEDGWTSTGWYVTDGIVDNGLGVVTLDTRGVPTERYPEPASNDAMPLLSVSTMTIDPDTQSGTDSTPPTPAKSGRVRVSIVSNHADHSLPSQYQLWVTW